MSAALANTATIIAFPQGRLTPRFNLGSEGFTLADRLALQGWNRRCAALGYGRVHVEPPRPGAGPDSAAFALLYRHDDPWSRWGLSRGTDGITLWCSLTGHDMGTFPTMDQALAAVD